MAIRLILVLFWSFLFRVSNNQPERQQFPFFGDVYVEQPVGLPDSLNNQLMLVSDTLLRPLFYYTDLFTAVCDDGRCLPVEIRLFRDVCGEFLGFKADDCKPLTKADHKKFSRDDYRKLFFILNDPDAPISQWRKRDLLQHDDLTPQPDAVSSATISGIPDVVVPGAAFTTYTLWHWVNRERVIPDSGKFFHDKKKSREDWVACFSDLKGLTTRQLTCLLWKADRAGVLRIRKIQQLVAEEAMHLCPLHALLVNNYLNRQPHLSRKVKQIMNNQQELRIIFDEMAGSGCE